jgi:hypothetical protein
MKIICRYDMLKIFDFLGQLFQKIGHLRRFEKI